MRTEPGRRVDLQAPRACAARDDRDTAGKLADERIRQHVDRGLLIELQDGAVAEEHLDAPALGAQAIAGVERQVGLDVFGRGVVFEHGTALDVGHVRRGRGFLGERVRERRGPPGAHPATRTTGGGSWYAFWQGWLARSSIARRGHYPGTLSLRGPRVCSTVVQTALDIAAHSAPCD